MSDLQIAATAIRHSDARQAVTVVHYDADFENVARASLRSSRTAGSCPGAAWPESRRFRPVGSGIHLVGIPLQVRALGDGQGLDPLVGAQG